MTALLLGGLERPAPIGRVLLASDGKRVLALDFDDPETRLLPPLRRRFGAGVRLREAGDPQGFVTTLAAYFDGELEALRALPLDPGGTPFQQRVWSALREIPPGRTLSYGALAARIGRPTAVRAVGHANGQNPISIAVPCHRLIGSGGALTGYGGGLARKRWLLAHEGAPGLPSP